MEYFRNFKAKGQTNNYGGKKKEKQFLKMCFKGKELEIQNNYRECIRGSPRENQFDAIPSVSSHPRPIINSSTRERTKEPANHSYGLAVGLPDALPGLSLMDNPPLCIIVARVMFDPGVQHSDLTSLHALLCSPPARPPPAPARGSDDLADDIPGRCLCDCPVAYTPGEAERGGQGCWRPAATSQTAPPASRQPLVLAPRKGHPPGV